MIPWFLQACGITLRQQRWRAVIRRSRRVITLRRTIWTGTNKRSFGRLPRTINSSSFNRTRSHLVSPVNNLCWKCPRHWIIEISWNFLDCMMMSAWSYSLRWSTSVVDCSSLSLSLLVCRSYIDFVKDRADYHTKILPHDHRNRQEKEKANQVWKNLRPRGNTKGSTMFLF